MKRIRKPLKQSVLQGCILLIAVLCLVLSLLNYWNDRRMQYSHYESYIENILRYTAYLDMPAFTAAPFDVSKWMDGFIPSMMAVTIKQLYGWVLYIAGALAIGFLLWDIPTVRRTARRFPTWPVVGARFLARRIRRNRHSQGQATPHQ